MKVYTHSDLRAYVRGNLDYAKIKSYETIQLEQYYLADDRNGDAICTLSGPNNKAKSLAILQAINDYGTIETAALIICEKGDDVEMFQDTLKATLKSDFEAIKTKGCKCEHEIDCVFIDHADYVENLPQASVWFKNLSNMNIKVVMACYTATADTLVTRLGFVANIQYKDEFKVPASCKVNGDAQKKPNTSPKTENKDKREDAQIDIDKTYSVIVPMPADLLKLKQRLAEAFEYYASTQFVKKYVLDVLFELMEQLPELCEKNPQEYATKIRDLSLEINDQNGAANPSLAKILDMDVLAAATKIAMSRFERDKKNPAEANVYVFPNGVDSILLPKGKWFEGYMLDESTKEQSIACLKAQFSLLSYNNIDKNAKPDTDMSIRLATWQNTIRDENAKIIKYKNVERDAIVLHVGDRDSIKKHLAEVSTLGNEARGLNSKSALDTIILSKAKEYTAINKRPNHAKANAFTEYAQDTGLYDPDYSSETMKSLQAEFAARCDIPGSRANIIYEKYKKDAKSYEVDFEKPETMELAFGLVRDIPGIQPLYRN